MGEWEQAGVPAQTDADPDLVDVGAEALGAKLAEIGPIPADPHMALLRELARAVLEAAGDEVREAAMVAHREPVVNRMPRRVELLESGFLASRPPGMEEDIQARAVQRRDVDTPAGWGDR